MWRVQPDNIFLEFGSKRLMDTFDKTFLDYAHKQLEILAKIYGLGTQYSDYHLGLSFASIAYEYLNNRFFDRGNNGTIRDTEE